MHTRALHPWLSGAAILALCAAAVLLPIRPAPAQTLSGFDVFRSNCGGCHPNDEPPYDPATTKRSRQEWEKVLNRMVKVRGATLNPQELTAVLNYVDSFNQPQREIQWLETPAKTHKAALDPKQSGKLPAEWIDLVIGGDTRTPWAVQADTAGKGAYLSPLKTVAEGQYPVLIDNSGLVQDGAISVRTQIQSGKDKVGAGVVFGFKSSQSYFGVRVGPRDVVLYEVQGGSRALLARAPLAVAPKQWHALSLEIASKSVKVALDGKPLPDLARAIPEYRGGKVGVHTQGDTVALFDNWQVTVR